MRAATGVGYWRTQALASVTVLFGIILVAATTGIWVLTAIPVGFLFGFFLQKGDLCGTSAFSEVLLMRDGRKVYGLWVCIVVSMLAFALLQALGWATLNPKPLFPLNHIVGGIVFGVGIVLAGGCVTGSLFKAGAGNLNSMAALVAIPLGVGMVEYGPLRSLHITMRRFVIGTGDGGPMTLPSITGLPFGVIGLVLATATLLVTLAIRRGRRTRAQTTTPERPWLQRLLVRPWKPWQAGVAIGILAGPALLSSASSGRNYPLGVTQGVLGVQLLITHRVFNHQWRPKTPISAKRLRPQASARAAPARTAADNPQGRRIVWWLVAVVGSLVVGSWTSARWSGQARLLPKPPAQTIVAFFGGILVGAGARLGMGCITGNILSGWALMSVGSIVFGVVTMLANWATTYFYLMGGTLRGSR